MAKDTGTVNTAKCSSCWGVRLSAVSIMLVILGSAALWACIFFEIGLNAQIRTDTGDLRYRFFFIPLRYERMAPASRSRILSVTSLPPAIPAKWVTVVTYPLEGSNNPDLQCRYYYYTAALWVPVDPKIARFVLEDVDSFVRTIDESGYPECVALLSTLSVINTGGATRTIIPGWREDRGVLEYLDAKRYIPPPPAETDVAIKERLLREAASNYGYCDDTPLCIAALGGYVGTARLLVAEGVDVNAPNGYGETPLELAAWRGNTGFVAFLLGTGARFDSKNRALRQAAQHGHADVVAHLLKAGARHDAFTAAATGDVTALRAVLIANPAAVNDMTKSDETLLDWAAMNGQVETTRLLLERKARLAPSGCENGPHPLHKAALGGHLKVAKLLLDAGANVNEMDWREYTPLHRAVEGGHRDMAELLLAHGADRHALGGAWRRTTPTAWALRHGHEELAEWLR